MRGRLSIALLCSVLYSGCELAIHPDEVAPPGSGGGPPVGGGPPAGGGGDPAGHAIRSGRLGAAAGDASATGSTGVHSIRAGSLGPGGTAASPGTGHRIREGHVDP